MDKIKKLLAETGVILEVFNASVDPELYPEIKDEIEKMLPKIRVAIRPNHHIIRINRHKLVKWYLHKYCSQCNLRLKCPFTKSGSLISTDAWKCKEYQLAYLTSMEEDAELVTASGELDGE